MRIRVLDQAATDLIEGFHFYEDQQVGLGSYFLASLHADIEILALPWLPRPASPAQAGFFSSS
jgi:hypothetical protein